MPRLSSLNKGNQKIKRRINATPDCQRKISVAEREVMILLATLFEIRGLYKEIKNQNKLN
jgi:hypothetical protein